MLRVIVLAVLGALLLLVAPASAAFTPPPIQGHVTDTAGKLRGAERAAIESKLQRYRTQSSNEIAVLIAPSLEGDTIEAAAYTTFNTWKLGLKGQDNGVLLMIAVAERKVRIETGKGVVDELPDARAGEIIRTKIAPRLKEDRYRDALEDGTDGIIQALGPDPAGTRPPTRSIGFALVVAGALVALVLLCALVFVLARRSRGRNVPLPRGRGT